MIVAPQFNYISMMIPITISEAIYEQDSCLIKAWYWNIKKSDTGSEHTVPPKSWRPESLKSLSLQQEQGADPITVTCE